jgi:hypothetical protein
MVTLSVIDDPAIKTMSVVLTSEQYAELINDGIRRLVIPNDGSQAVTVTLPTECDYLAESSEFGLVRWTLRTARHPVIRAALLYRLAAIVERQAGMHADVFGPDPIPYEDGRDPSVSLAYSARLLRIVAKAERRRCIDEGWEAFHDELEEPVAGLLRMFARRGPQRRLLRQLCIAWCPLVGGQAVETIACLPVPRWWVW